MTKLTEIIIDGEKGKVEIQFMNHDEQIYKATVPAPHLLLDFIIGLVLEGEKAFGNDFTSLYKEQQKYSSDKEQTDD